MRTITAGDLRAEQARRGVLTYKLAALVGMNPSMLSSYLNEKRPLSAELAERLWAILTADPAPALLQESWTPPSPPPGWTRMRS